MHDNKKSTLESGLAALEAAIPFLRQSMPPEQFDAQIRDCCRDILASAEAGDEVVSARKRLNRIPDPIGVPFLD